MTDALNPGANVYEGIWTDWSRGKTWGLTWTLCPTQATILTNALAVFVTITGIRLWTIIRYALYHLGASAQPAMTPTFRKTQVILRNAGSDLATAWLMFKLGWSSAKRDNKKRSCSSYGMGLFALIYAILFWVAGVFSNKAISASTSNGTWSVLAQSKACGVWNETYLDIIENAVFESEFNYNLFVQRAAKSEFDMQASLAYASECYLSPNPSEKLSSSCMTLKTAKLDWTTSYNGSCPFEAHLCHKSAKAIVLDTGYIDSHEDLGINASPKDRIKYRRMTRCAVLEDGEHVTGWNGNLVDVGSTKPVSETAYALYGPSQYKGTNWTYSYSNFPSFYDAFSTQVTLPYQLDSEVAYALADPQWSPSDFDPVPALAQDDADIVLFFLSYVGKYLGEVDDPWFAAHREEKYSNAAGFLQSRFSKDAAISTLGCAVQHQFCTTNDTCTQLLGFDQVQNNATFSASFTDRQNATFDRILRAVSASNLYWVVMNLAGTTTPMLATSVTQSGGSGAVLSTKLPDDQWTLEVNFWHSISLAQLQRTIAQFVTGQVAPEPQLFPYLLPPTLEQDKWFCKNFIIPSMVFQSFKLVTIIMIIVFGTLIIIVSLTIEDLEAVVRKCMKRPPPPRNWDRFDMLGERTPMRTQFEFEESSHNLVPHRPKSNPGIGIRANVAGLNLNRLSSPTLPPEDRFIPVLKASRDDHKSVELKPAPPPLPPFRPARDSWFAISLNEFDGSTHDDREHTMPTDKDKQLPTPPSRFDLTRLPAARPYQHGMPFNYSGWV
jgi:hypothetical protein